MKTIYVNNHAEYVATCKKVVEEGGKVLNMYTNVKTKDGIKIAIIIK